jgi:hypothetical protein
MRNHQDGIEWLGWLSPKIEDVEDGGARRVASKQILRHRMLIA